MHFPTSQTSSFFLCSYGLTQIHCTEFPVLGWWMNEASKKYDLAWAPQYRSFHPCPHPGSNVVFRSPISCNFFVGKEGAGDVEFHHLPKFWFCDSTRRSNGNSKIVSSFLNLSSQLRLNAIFGPKRPYQWMRTRCDLFLNVSIVVWVRIEGKRK